MSRGAGGSTPLMAAALYGDAALVKRLLAAGADPERHQQRRRDRADVGGARRGEDAAPARRRRRRQRAIRRSPIGARSSPAAASAPRRRCGCCSTTAPIRRRGVTADVSPLREAARVDDVEMFRLLLEYGANPKGAGAPSATTLRTNCFACAEAAGVAAGGPLPRVPPPEGAGSTAPRYDPGRAARPTPVGATSVTPAAIRAAVERSLPLLQDVGVAFIKQTGCVSCHHNSVVSMAVAAARAHGYPVNEATAKQQASTIGTYLESWRERTVQNMPIAGGADTISYLLLGLAADDYPPDAATDAQATWLKRRQAKDGRWPVAHHPAADRIERHRSDRGLAAGAAGVCAAVTARRIPAGGRPRARLADDRRGDRDRGARVPSARPALGRRVARRPRRRGARAARDSEGRWRMGAARHDGQRRVCNRGGAGRAARKRRRRCRRSRLPQGPGVSAAHADRRRIVDRRDAGGADSGLLRERLSVRREPVDVSRRDRLGDDRAGAGRATRRRPRARFRVRRRRPGPPRPEDGSAAPDGYAPMPQWLGQTRAPQPAKTAAYAVETVAEGLSGAFCFGFLPDGRIIVGERAGPHPDRRQGRQGLGRRSTGCRPISGRRARACSKCAPIARFATNRTIYLTYTVLPDGANPAALPRSPGVLLVASATLSADDRRLERREGAAQRRRHRRTADPGARRHAAHHVDDSRRRRHQLGRLAAAAAARQRHGQGAADQRRRIDSRRTTRLSAAPARIPRSTRSASATCRAWRSIRAPARCGSSEHGPRGGDEINAIAKGKNYGFPVIGYGREYTGKPINGDKTAQDGHGAAGLLLDARHRAGRDRVLHRHAVSGVAGQSVRVGARRQDRWSASCSNGDRVVGRGAAAHRV